MHYMIRPPSDKVLAPSLCVLESELRDWAANFAFRFPTPFSLDSFSQTDSQQAAERSNEVMNLLCGYTRRPLWIKAYDILGHFDSPECISAVVIQDFRMAFGADFWSLIPASEDPHRDAQERLLRSGTTSSCESGGD